MFSFIFGWSGFGISDVCVRQCEVKLVNELLVVEISLNSNTGPKCVATFLQQFPGKQTKQNEQQQQQLM